jgi:hypothetical protein
MNVCTISQTIVPGRGTIECVGSLGRLNSDAYN